MYLLARQLEPNNFLTEWKGRKGKFVRTFGFNDERNNNEWRSPWKATKLHIATALGRPGIEFTKCDEDGCSLDHFDDAESFEENIEKQKPYARTTVIDFVPDENTKTMDLIHEVHDDAFWERLKTGKIKWVSPMIWPADNGLEKLGTGRLGLPILDAHHWKFVHVAFLEKNPAYGEAAGIRTMCEGDDCGVQMLSAKLMSQTTTSAPGDDLDPLKEIPILYRHKGSLHFVSASQKVKDMIVQRKKEGVKIDDQELASIMAKCKDPDEESPFITCSCKSKHNMTIEDDNKELKSKLQAMEDDHKKLESKFTAMEDENKKKPEMAKARYASLIANMTDEEKDKMSASVKAMEDEEEMKAMDEAMKENKAKKATSDSDPEKKDMQARLQAMESDKSVTMIDGLVAVRKGKISDGDLTKFETSLKAQTYLEIQTQFKNEEYQINSLPAKEIKSEFEHFEFDGPMSASNSNGLAAKTIGERNGEETE